MKNKIGLITVIILLIILAKPSVCLAADRFWEVQSIDTMKYSRDLARDESVKQKIPGWIQQIADLKPTHIAIGTPYNDEFIPILTEWSNEIHKQELHVWYRGNFSEWEGWFGYQKYQNPEQHHEDLKRFIRSNKDIFQDGDILTPAPEPENGGFGDPRQSPETAKAYRQFLITSYQTCTTAFKEIKKNVRCGYFSMNGDVVKQVLTRNTIEQIGGVVVIDHYVKDPINYGNDIEHFYQQYGFPIVIGEIGAPIPNLHGSLDEAGQASLIDGFLHELYAHKDIITGVNYWVFSGSETALFNTDGRSRLAAEVVKNYYDPVFVSGRIMNTVGDALPNSIVYNPDFQGTQVEANGEYGLIVPAGKRRLTVKADGYISSASDINLQPGKNYIQDFILEPVKPDNWYSFRSKLRNLRRLFYPS